MYDLNYNQIDKDVPLAKILPQKQNFTKVIDLEHEKNIGPGLYDPEFGQVEKRVDIGVPKLAKLNWNNERQMVIEKNMYKEANDPDLDPMYDWVKKRVPAVLMKGPVERKEPPNIPDHMVFPERWEFYDKDVAAIKERGDTFGKFANGDFQKFQLDEKEKEILTDYLNLGRRLPEVGYYDPVFKLLEQGIAVPDFEKYIYRPKALTREELMERDIDGDNLLLEPFKKGPKLADIDFGKIEGRKEPKKPNELDGEMLLEKNYDQVEKKLVNYVNMDKQEDRKPIFGGQPKGELDTEMDLDINRAPIEPKVVGLVNMERDVGRKVNKRNQEIVEDEFVPDIRVSLIKPKNPCFVNYQKPHEKREADPGMGGQPPEPLDYDKMIRATRPEPAIVDFNRYDHFRDEKKANKNDAKVVFDKKDRYVQDFGDNDDNNDL